MSPFQCILSDKRLVFLIFGVMIGFSISFKSFVQVEGINLVLRDFIVSDLVHVKAFGSWR